MPTWTFTVPTHGDVHNTWEVTDLYQMDGSAHIVIPVDALDGMTDEDIALAVRSAAVQARVLAAIEIAASVLTGDVENNAEIWHVRNMHACDGIPTVAQALRIVEQYRNPPEEIRAPVVPQIQDTRRAQAGYIYILKSDHGYKIGRSKDVPSRTKAIGTQMPFPFDLIHTIECDDYVEAETYLHGLFTEKRLNGEWFNLSDTDVAWLLRLQANCAEPMNDAEQSQ